MKEEYRQEAFRLALLDDNTLENICFARLHLGYVWLACDELERAFLTFQGDASAKPLFATVYTQLQRNASKIADPRLLRCFWVAPAHDKIRAL
jgi:hypothetical protein